MNIRPVKDPPQAPTRRTSDGADESGSKYRGLLEAAPDAMVVVNQAGEIVLLNLQAEKQFGYHRDELVGQPVTNIIPDGFAERLVADDLRSAEDALAQGIGTGIELVGRRKDGSAFPIEIMLSPLESAEGILVTAAIRDISVRKAADTALADSEQRFRDVLEAAPDAMIAIDTTATITYVNPQAVRTFGYLREELLGQAIELLLPDRVAGQHGAYRTEFLAHPVARSMGIGLDLSGRRKDGTEFPVEISLSPVHHSSGLQVFATVVDVTARKAAERHLVQMEGRYRGLLEAAPDAMVVVDQGGAIVLLNVQAEQQFGYHRDELVGQPVTNIIPDGFAERLVADDLRSAEDALAQQIGAGIELVARRKDGSDFPIEIMLSPLESAEGILVTAAIRDISVRKAAEQHLAQMEGSRRLVEDALRESEENYRMLLDGVEDHAIFIMDPRGQILSWNAGAQRIKGYTADEIVGQNYSVFFPGEEIARGRPEDVLRLTAEKGRHEEQGMRVRKDGSRFLASIAFTALRDRDGNLRGFSEFSHDLSESKEAGAKYRGLLEAAPDAMVVVNQAGEIVLLNLQAEKQFGYHRDELVGQPVTNIIPDGFAERLIADDLRSAADALGQQIGTGIELVARRKDGSDFPIEIMLSPLESADGVLVTAAIRDISVRRAAEEHLGQKVEELKRSNEELGQFAYIASHDLQEPLRMVASYTQLLSKRYKGQLDADADEFIAFAVDGASRMQRLIEDLLSFSRVATAGNALADTSSEYAFEQALQNLHWAIKDSAAQVTHDPLPIVQADQMQLIQLFQNLVGNAIKYQGLGIPYVHISVSQSGPNLWTFAVKDNGLGIDPQYFERIFGMFQRLHKRDEYSGTGVGLAICKKIVERHGGSLWVESELGHGATFKFALSSSEQPA
jgi:PAS domain S-box-containing protein